MSYSNKEKSKVTDQDRKEGIEKKEKKKPTIPKAYL